MVIADTTLRNLVAGEGDTVNRTIVSYPASGTYVPGTDITSQAVRGSKESLTIGTWLDSMVTIDDTEKAQSIIDVGTLAAERMMKQLNNKLDQAIFSEVTNASWTLDDGNIGGTAGNNAQVNTNTVPQFFIAADTKLDAIDAPKAGRTAVVGGHFMGQLKLQQAGRPGGGGGISDGVNTRGVVAQLFGWNILYSNNLPYSAVLTLTVNPSDGDTVTIAGVVFTWKTTLGTTVAGALHICSDAAHSRASFAAVLNAVDTGVATATDAGYLVISDDNIFLLRDKRGITAVDDVSTKITLSGFGDIVVSSSFTSTSNVWSAWRQDSLFCTTGCISMIVQIPPRVEVVRNPKQFADIVKALMGYGKKTYADGAREMVRVKINAGTSDWA